MNRCVHKNSIRLWSIVLGVFILLAGLCVPKADVIAAPGPVISLMIDGHGIATDVQPLQKNGRMLVPIRVIAEQTGAKVHYEEPTRQAVITQGEEKIVIPIDQSAAFVNGKRFILDVPATIVSQRTLIPIRFVSEALGCQVNWDDTSRIAAIWTPNAKKKIASKASELAQARPADSSLGANGDRQLLQEHFVFPLAAGSHYEPYDPSFGSDRDWTEDGDGSVRSHEGIDIMTASGTPVYAVSSGTINRIGWNTYGGWRINITDDGGAYKMYYAHLLAYAPGLVEGSYVKAGQLIGFVGATGYGEPGTSGLFSPHLHFGLYQASDNKAIDPYPYLRFWERHKINALF